MNLSTKQSSHRIQGKKPAKLLTESKGQLLYTI